MPQHQLHIVCGGILHGLQLLIGELAYSADGASQPKIATLQGFSLGHQGACPEHHGRFEHGTVKNCRSHADKTAVSDITAVQQDLVAHRHTVADDQGAATRQIAAIVGNVQH